MKKSLIRKIILKKRLNFNYKNKKINYLNLIKLLKMVTKKNIGLYYPIGSEVCTIEIIQNLKKKKIYYFFASFREKLQNVIL